MPTKTFPPEELPDVAGIIDSINDTDGLNGNGMPGSLHSGNVFTPAIGKSQVAFENGARVGDVGVVGSSALNTFPLSVNANDPEGSSASAAATSTGAKLIVQVVRSNDTPVDGHFELPISLEALGAQVSVAVRYAPNIDLSNFRLTFALQFGTDVSEPLVVDQRLGSPGPRCGNGFGHLDPGESCEPPGSLFSTFGVVHRCRADCTACGDAAVNGSEECDVGGCGAGDTCDSSCACQNGGLAFFTEQLKGVGGVTSLDGPRAVAVSHDGQFVYTASVQSDSVEVFARSQSNGSLTYRQQVRKGAAHPERIGLFSAKWITFDSNDTTAYVAGSGDHAIAILARDASTGKLDYVGSIKQGEISGGATVTGLTGPRQLVVSADGKNVYAVSQEDNSLTSFDRAADGSLTFINAVVSDPNQGDNLKGVFGIAIPQDGKNVYTASPPTNTIAIFNRDQTGVLQFAGRVRDEEGGITSLGRVNRLAVSPDGGYLYAAAGADHAVTVFKRLAGGSLSLVEAHRDDVDGVDGLQGAQVIAVSPDGARVYVGGAFDNSIAAFERDSTNGRLHFIEAELNGAGGFDSLLEPSAIAVSPDSKYVYLTAEQGDSLLGFRVPQ